MTIAFRRTKRGDERLNNDLNTCGDVAPRVDLAPGALTVAAPELELALLALLALLVLLALVALEPEPEPPWR